MSLNQEKRNDEPLSEESRYFVIKMVERYMQMSREEQEAHLKEVEKRLEYFAQQRKKIEESKSTERTSSISSSDHSPTHLKKTISLITQEKVGEFRTESEPKPKIHSQQEIKESKEESGSKSKIADYSFVSEYYEISKLEGNEENLYLIPEKYDTPEKQKAFCKKVIKPLKFLGIEGNEKSYKRAMESREKIKEHPNSFKEVKNLGLFYMDLVTERSRDLGINYLRLLKELNKLLMFKIEIGMKTERNKLLKVFEIHWESLVEIILERIWSEDSEEEHGLDFFTCKENLKKIKKITLLGNYLTKKFYESLKEIELPQLQVLEMNFEQEVDHEKLLGIFQVINAYNDNFEIHLVTCLKNKNELPPLLTENYGERIYLIDRTKKPSEKLENQRPVEKINYEKPVYQIAYESREKLGPKPVYIPKNLKKPNINPNIPLQNVPQVQGISNNIIPTEQVQGLSNPIQPIVNATVLTPQQQISGIGIYADHHSSIQGIKIGNTEFNQKTEHHHHTHINQTTERIIENHHYQTDTESRSGRSNYGGSRSQYNGGRRGGNYYTDSSSDDEPYYNNYNNGYSYRGRNNYNYKKKYYNNNRYNGYYKKWYEDDY